MATIIGLEALTYPGWATTDDRVSIREALQYWASRYVADERFVAYVRFDKPYVGDSARKVLATIRVEATRIADVRLVPTEQLSIGFSRGERLGVVMFTNRLECPECGEPILQHIALRHNGEQALPFWSQSPGGCTYFCEATDKWPWEAK